MYGTKEDKAPAVKAPAVKEPTVLVRKDENILLVYDNPDKNESAILLAQEEILFHGHTLEFEKVPEAIQLELKSILDNHAKMETLTKYLQQNESKLYSFTMAEIDCRLETLKALIYDIAFLERYFQKRTMHMQRLISVQTSKNEKPHTAFVEELRRLDEKLKALSSFKNHFEKTSNFSELLKLAHDSGSYANFLGNLNYKPKSLLFNNFISSLKAQSTILPHEKLKAFMKSVDELRKKTNLTQKKFLREKARTQTTDILKPVNIDKKKRTIYDQRFNIAFIPFEHEGHELKLSHWSTAKLPKETSKPKCFVFANCLFAGMLQGADEKGENRWALVDHHLKVTLGKHILSGVTHHKTWSLYEMTMFAQLEAQLSMALAMGDKDVRFNYHLPEEGYILSGLKLFLAGKMTLEPFCDYMEAVKARAKAHRIVVKRIFKEAGISDDRYEITSPFANANINEVIAELTNPLVKMDRSEETIVNKILQALLTNTSHPVHCNAWKKILPADILVAIKKISAYKDQEKDSEIKTLTDAEIRLMHINSLEDLMHFANSMMISIANQQVNQDEKQDFTTVAFHSIDEQPIANGYETTGMTKVFGEAQAIFVLPQVLYYGDAQCNNLFRVTPKTDKTVKETFIDKLSKVFNLSDFLKHLFWTKKIDGDYVFEDANQKAEQINPPAQSSAFPSFFKLKDAQPAVTPEASSSRTMDSPSRFNVETF